MICFVRVLNAAPDIAQQVIGVVQVVTDADPYAGCCRRAACVRGLMKQFSANLQLRQQLVREHAAGQAGILGSSTADHTASTSEDGPAATPILLDPNGEKDRGTVVTHRVGAARQEHARKNGDIPAEGVLMQEAILRGELDIAQADVRLPAAGAVKAGRQRGRQLEVGRSAVVEIDAGLAAGSIARGRTIAERVDLEMFVIRRFRVVGYVRRSGQRGLHEHHRHRAEERYGGDGPRTRHCAPSLTGFSSQRSGQTRRTPSRPLAMSHLPTEYPDACRRPRVIESYVVDTTLALVESILLHGRSCRPA